MIQNSFTDLLRWPIRKLPLLLLSSVIGVSFMGIIGETPEIAAVFASVNIVTVFLIFKALNVLIARLAQNPKRDAHAKVVPKPVMVFGSVFIISAILCVPLLMSAASFRWLGIPRLPQLALGVAGVFGGLSLCGFLLMIISVVWKPFSRLWGPVMMRGMTSFVGTPHRISEALLARIIMHGR